MRATNHLSELRRFYEDGLGLEVIASFEGQAGYSGVIFALLDQKTQLELTQHEAKERIAPPDKGQQMVFYLPDKESIGRLVVKLGAMGYFPVPPVNPYWDTAVTIEDPDGWRVVLTEAL